MWDLNDLASVGDIASEYGVGKPAVSNWQARYPDYPRPLVTLTSGEVFSRAQVRAWHTAWVARHRLTR